MVGGDDAPAPPAAQESALMPTPEADGQESADRMLPETGGYSDLQLLAGLTMLGAGVVAMFASRRKSLA